MVSAAELSATRPIWGQPGVRSAASENSGCIAEKLLSDVGRANRPKVARLGELNAIGRYYVGRKCASRRRDSVELRGTQTALPGVAPRQTWDHAQRVRASNPV